MRKLFSAEIRRLLKSGIFYVLAAVCAAVCAVLCVYYDGEFYYQTNYNGYGIVRYETEDIPSVLENLEEEAAECETALAGTLPEAQREYFEDILSDLKIQIQIYRYLYAHGIAWEDYQDFAGFHRYYGDSAISAFESFSELLTGILPLIFAIFSLYFTVRDMKNGAWKFLYASDTPRLKIMEARFLVWLAVSAAGTVLCCLVCAGLSFLFGGAEGTVIFATETIAFGTNYFGIICMETGSILFMTLVSGCVTFGVSLFTKSVLLSVIPAACFFTASFFTYALAETIPFFSVFFGGILQIFTAGGITAPAAVSGVLAAASLAVLALSCGGLYFRHKDLK